VPALIAAAAGLILALALLTMNGFLDADRNAVPEEGPEEARARGSSSAAGTPAIVAPQQAESDREPTQDSRNSTPEEADHEPSGSQADSSRPETQPPSTPRQETGDEVLAAPLAVPDPVRQLPPERRIPTGDQTSSASTSSERLDSSRDDPQERAQPQERERPRPQSNLQSNLPPRTRPRRSPARIDADTQKPFAFDRKLETGMTLFLDANPEDAFVVIDGFVIGRANEVNRRGGHTLAQPGEHRVVLRSPGMREYRLLVDASGSERGTTRVKVVMERAPASELTLGDLPRYLVREGIGFRINPKTARVVVDGQVRGPAIRFNGRGGHWLSLPRGTHRISLVAPGHTQVDIAVEVGSSATQKRQIVRLNLPPERP